MGEPLLTEPGSGTQSADRLSHTNSGAGHAQGSTPRASPCNIPMVDTPMVALD
jgi:hypothetical protein